MSLESQIANLFQEFVNQQRGKLASEVSKMQEEVKDAYQQRDKLAVEVGNLQKELVEVSQRRDRLTIENAGLHGKLDNLNDRITELEDENKDLKASNAANAHLSQDVLNMKAENEALKKRVQVAEELLGEPEKEHTESTDTVTIEAWLIGHAADRLRLVWATEGHVRSIRCAIVKRASEANFVGDEPYFAPVKVTL